MTLHVYLNILNDNVVQWSALEMSTNYIEVWKKWSRFGGWHFQIHIFNFIERFIEANISLGNDLVLSANKPLFEPIFLPSPMTPYGVTRPQWVKHPGLGTQSIPVAL